MPTKPKVITKAQIMHVVTMFVIVPLSGYVTAWVARHFPGLPNFNSATVEGIFITGAASALGLGLHYLHGWQLWERTVGRLIDVEDKAPEDKSAQASAGPPVIIHVHNPKGQVTGNSGQDQGGDAPGGQAQQPPASPQAITTPANEQSQGITGV